jgi:hypothetical protein
MKKGKRFLIPIFIATLVGILSAACSNTPTVIPATPSQNVSTAPTQKSVPTIAIVTPSSGNKFAIGSVKVTVQVTGFNLANKIGQANSPGEGHIVYYMDVDPPTTAGKTALTDPGTYAASSNTSYTWNDVYSGTQKFSVQLVNNDNTPLSPAATASASLLVIPEIGPPLAVIVSPRTNALIKGSSITISTQVTNFNLADKIGQPNTAREGHLIFYMDVEPPTVQGQTVNPTGSVATVNTSYQWQNVTAGLHTFAIQVVNNDNTSLSPPVVASIVVTVSP